MLRGRWQLLWLLVPYLVFLGAVPLVNRVEPVLFGLPFLWVWLLGATLVTPLAVWLAWRGDRRSARPGEGRSQGGEGAR